VRRAVNGVAPLTRAACCSWRQPVKGAGDRSMGDRPQLRQVGHLDQSRRATQPAYVRDQQTGRQGGTGQHQRQRHHGGQPTTGPASFQCGHSTTEQHQQGRRCRGQREAAPQRRDVAPVDHETEVVKTPVRWAGGKAHRPGHRRGHQRQQRQPDGDQQIAAEAGRHPSTGCTRCGRFSGVARGRPSGPQPGTEQEICRGDHPYRDHHQQQREGQGLEMRAGHCSGPGRSRYASSLW